MASDPARVAWSETLTKLGDAADQLHSIIYPGDEVRGPRGDLPQGVVQQLVEVARLMSEAEGRARGIFPGALRD